MTSGFRHQVISREYVGHEVEIRIEPGLKMSRNCILDDGLDSTPHSNLAIVAHNLEKPT